LTNTTFPILHTARDQIEAIHIGEYYDSYRLIAAYLAYLDQMYLFDGSEWPSGAQLGAATHKSTGPAE